MSELSPHARAIIDAARNGDGPTAADKIRVRAALLAQIAAAGAASTAQAAVSSADAASATSAAGGDAGPGTLANISAESSQGAAAASSGTASSTGAITGGIAANAGKLIVAVAVGASIGLGGYFLATQGSDTPSPVVQPAITETAPAPAEHPSLPEPTRPETATVEDSQPAPPPAQRATIARPMKRPERSAGTPPAAIEKPPLLEPEPEGHASDLASLSEEHRLIRNAKRALDSGDADGALALLSEHGRRFASGQLGQERSALRIIALCKLGRHQEAEGERDRFATSWPQSSHADRIDRACRAR